jgi:ABC-type Mn2+/Zn2+ transport system ATPase subunit
VNTAVLNKAIYRFYYQFAMKQSILHMKRTQLQLVKSYLDEAIRIESKIFTPTHPNRVSTASKLTDILHELSNV